jgi:hypothetical protein
MATPRDILAAAQRMLAANRVAGSRNGFTSGVAGNVGSLSMVAHYHESISLPRNSRKKHQGTLT